MNQRIYQICTFCVMDTTDADIQFDETGVCNYCRNYLEEKKNRVVEGVAGERRLKQIVEKIKADGYSTFGVEVPALVDKLLGFKK